MKGFYRGGTIANTISGVPERIDGMLRNYKKVAIGTVNITKEIKNGEIKIPIPINFEPSVFIIKIGLQLSYMKATYHLNSRDGQKKYIISSNGNSVDFKVSFKDGDVIINVANSEYYETYTITDWIAIE